MMSRRAIMMRFRAPARDSGTCSGGRRLRSSFAATPAGSEPDCPIMRQGSARSARHPRLLPGIYCSFSSSRLRSLATLVSARGVAARQSAALPLHPSLWPTRIPGQQGPGHPGRKAQQAVTVCQCQDVPRVAVTPRPQWPWTLLERAHCSRRCSARVGLACGPLAGRPSNDSDGLPVIPFPD
jgi:hypothetical protein